MFNQVKKIETMNPKRQIQLFIVEDNQTFAMAMKSDIERAFIKMNVKVHLFTTGEDCIENFKAENPQVIILDYYLNSKYPDAMDGIKVLDLIIKEKKDAFVIMLTRNYDIDIAIKSFKHGASDYIVKSESQFKKITFSLLNFIIMKAKNDVEKYKQIIQKHKESFIINNKNIINNILT